jgi:hypothetical protein
MIERNPYLSAVIGRKARSAEDEHLARALFGHFDLSSHRLKALSMDFKRVDAGPQAWVSEDVVVWIVMEPEPLMCGRRGCYICALEELAFGIQDAHANQRTLWLHPRPPTE